MDRDELKRIMSEPGDTQSELDLSKPIDENTTRSMAAGGTGLILLGLAFCFILYLDLGSYSVFAYETNLALNYVCAALLIICGFAMRFIAKRMRELSDEQEKQTKESKVINRGPAGNPERPGLSED